MRARKQFSWQTDIQWNRLLKKIVYVTTAVLGDTEDDVTKIIVLKGSESGCIGLIRPSFHIGEGACRKMGRYRGGFCEKELAAFSMSDRANP